MSINQRIKILVDTIEKGNQSAFAKKIGVTPTVIGSFMPGGRESKPSFEVLSKILYTYPQLNSEWLMIGEGNMLKSEMQPNPISAEIEQFFGSASAKKHELQQIPLYDVTAAAGLDSLYNSNHNVLDYISIPNLPRCDGAIYVRGDSMYPLLKHGDIVAYQRITDYPEDIFFGEMYVVDLSTPQEENIVVKYVNESDKGEDYIRLVSYNEKHHKPKDVQLRKIRAIAKVKASIRIN